MKPVIQSEAEMGRKPAENPKSTVVSFRIDEETTERLDLQVEAEQRPGLILSRGDVAKMLLAEALAARAKPVKKK